MRTWVKSLPAGGGSKVMRKISVTIVTELGVGVKIAPYSSIAQHSRML